MNTLIVNIDKKIFEPGSASFDRLKLYAGFCGKISVVVFTLKNYQPILTEKVSIFPTNSCCKMSYIFDAWRIIKQIIKKEKIDLVVTQDPFETGLLGWFVKRKYKVLWQCQVHGDIMNLYFQKESFINKIRIIIAKILLPKADGIRVVSERIKKSLGNIKLRAEPFVLPIFPDKKKIESSPIKVDLKQKYPQFNFIILIASRLSQEKNIIMAIRALSHLVKKYHQIGLIIVGEGKEKEKLRFLVNKLEISKNVVFEPWSNEINSYYKTADLFILTSNYEGWGMSVIEAAICGAPIIMTNVGCAGEFIKNEENGLVIEVGDEKGLVASVDRLINDDNLRKNLSRRAKETVSLLPDHSKYLKLYEDSFIRVINKNKYDQNRNK